MKKFQMEYQPANSKLWLIIGEWFADDISTKDALYNEVDSMRGLLRVLDTETNIMIFQRPTASTPQMASDDCHTYS